MNLIKFNKPAGINTHSSNNTLPSVVQFIESGKQIKLFPCHRLDKVTSGALLLPTDKNTAKELTSFFDQQKVEKTYFLISQNFVNLENHRIEDSDGCTVFDFDKSVAGVHLYRAMPLSGKTHQIRKHAQKLGISILGDTTYGGAAFFRVMLHCTRIYIPEIQLEHLAPLPKYFEAEDLLENSSFWELFCCIEKRYLLFGENLFNHPKSSLRYVHTDHPDIHIDKLGEVFLFSLYNPDLSFQNITDKIQRLQNYFPIKKYLIRQMLNRGAESNKKELHKNFDQSSWTAEENGINFICKSDEGTSPGIFLDQRANRHWVQTHAINKKILNLFSYTSVFSVAAAKGGAHEVYSIDVSKKYLDWSKENFKLNQISMENNHFYKMDSHEFLNMALRKKWQFDLVICDPPSFSRFKKSVFKIEKDLLNLLLSCQKVLAPKGVILFSTNFEKWSYKDIESKLRPHFNILPPPMAEPDFELDGLNTRLKTFLIN